MPKVRIIFVIIIICNLSWSCNRNKIDEEVNEINLNVKIKRFDVDLFAQNYATPLERHASLKMKYGEFYNVVMHNILRIPEGNDSSIALNVDQFINDGEVKQVYSDIDSAYNSISEIENGMELFLKHLKYYFPEKNVPEVVTYLSAFNYAVVATDSVIGIGLDMFLGPNSFYYPGMGIPKYMFSKFSSEYIVPSAVKGWFQSDYDVSEVKKEFLSQVVYQGKLIYYMKLMIPETHDTLITGYTADQLKWCENNEAEIWSFFIENKLLFNTDPVVYNKFVNDGPSTNGFPENAPGKIGAYVGWQIVSEYMKKNNDLTIKDLLKENDSQKILELSGYKPKKK